MDPQQRSTAEAGERIARKRVRLIWLQAVLFTVWQGGFFATHVATEPLRNVDTVRIAAWLVWALALLGMLLTGGGWVWGRAVRRLLNDELSVHNRHEGQRAGFWGAAGACLLVYFLSFYEPIRPRDVVHLVLTLSIGAALFRYAWLERRGERGD